MTLTQTFELAQPARTLALELSSWVVGNPNATASKALVPYRLERVTLFKSLVRSFPGKLAGTRDVLALARLVTGKDQRALFDRYLFGTEIPAVAK